MSKSIQWAVCLLVLVCCDSAIAARPAQPWQPDEPVFAYGANKDIPVRMDDGVVLRADEYFPTDPTTSAKAPGRFPVLLVQTPYGKARGLQHLGDYFVRRGYVLVIADLRGFGASQGQAEWFGSRAGRDGVELADWASRLDEVDGKVGLFGCSYLGGSRGSIRRLWVTGLMGSTPAPSSFRCGSSGLIPG